MNGFNLRLRRFNLNTLAVVVALICAPILSWPAIMEFDKIALFGFFLLPFILRIEKAQIGASRYVILAALFALFFAVLGQSYWGLACGISLVFAAIELRLGRLNEIAFYALLFYLPITRSFFTLFGFHIRLEITQWATKLISFFNSSISFEGTQIFHGGDQFSVDAGCMGLRLVITGFLLTLLILNQTSLAFRIKLKSSVVSLFLLLSFILIISANFFRIVLLIVFRSAEGTISHELIGVVALILFHLIPMVFLIRFTLKKNWVVHKPRLKATKGHNTLADFGLLAVSIFMILQPVGGSNRDIAENIKYTFNGYSAKQSKDGVVTYSRGDAIFTIKPIHPLSFSNHHPMICWRGDGFEVSNEMKGEVGENECMRATLNSGYQQSLKTVWWYSNTVDFTTISELEWRVRALFMQEDFYILNFTSANDDELIFTINNLLRQIEKQNLGDSGHQPL